MQTSWARPCPLESRAVTGVPPPHGTWHPVIGSSDKLFPGRISGFKKKFIHCLYLLFLLFLFCFITFIISSISRLRFSLYFPGKSWSGGSKSTSRFGCNGLLGRMKMESKSGLKNGGKIGRKVTLLSVLFFLSFSCYKWGLVKFM